MFYQESIYEAIYAISGSDFDGSNCNGVVGPLNQITVLTTFTPTRDLPRNQVLSIVFFSSFTKALAKLARNIFIPEKNCVVEKLLFVFRYIFRKTRGEAFLRIFLGFLNKTI